MKELEGDKFSIETHINAEQKIETKIIGRVYLKPGQFMWWYDPRTNQMDKVKLRRTQLETGHAPKQETRINNGQLEYTIYEPSSTFTDTIHSTASWDVNKLYCIAINEKNASFKFAKQLHALTTKQK